MRLGAFQEFSRNAGTAKGWYNVGIGNVSGTIRIVCLSEGVFLFNPACRITCKCASNFSYQNYTALLADAFLKVLTRLHAAPAPPNEHDGRANQAG
jgi:hypothetical protein